MNDMSPSQFRAMMDGTASVTGATNFWLDPDGKFHRVKNHIDGAKLVQLGDNEIQSMWHVNEAMYARGWVRVAIEGGLLMFTYRLAKPPSRMQLSALKDFAIERGCEAYDDVKERFVESLSPNVEDTERDRRIIDDYKRRIQAGEKLLPVLLDKTNPSRIVDGNHRCVAYQELGMEPPTAEVDRVRFITDAARTSEQEAYEAQAGVVESLLDEGHNIELAGGAVHAWVEVTEDVIVIYEWSSVSAGRGNTRTALQELRSKYRRVEVMDVGDEHSESRQYWVHMFRAGLVDAIFDPDTEFAMTR